MSTEISQRYELAKTIAIEAGRQTLDLFQSATLKVERKGDNTPVTLADRNAEKLLRTRIHDAFPGDAIVGEEYGETAGTTAFRWILDPIDGTKSFVRGVPLFGTMVGVERAERSVIGAIFFPALDEGVHAAEGHGARWFSRGAADRHARVSDRKPLSECAFVTSEVKTFADRGAADAYCQLEERALVTRTWGDCYGYMLVATGRVDLMVDARLSIWDAAAVQPILKQAGGIFVDWAGNERIDAGEGIGTTPHLLDEVLSITREYAGEN